MLQLHVCVHARVNQMHMVGIDLGHRTDDYNTTFSTYFSRIIWFCDGSLFSFVFFLTWERKLIPQRLRRAASKFCTDFLRLTPHTRTKRFFLKLTRRCRSPPTGKVMRRFLPDWFGIQSVFLKIVDVGAFALFRREQILGSTRVIGPFLYKKDEKWKNN